MAILTRRGWILVTVAAGVAGAGWAMEQSSLVGVAALLILVPALGAIGVRMTNVSLGSSRTVTRSRIPLGEQSEVVLLIENTSRMPSGVLLLSDVVPPTLGSSARVLLDRVPPRAQRSVRYLVTPQERGRATIGPLAVTIVDPFDTARITRTFTATNTVLVTPHIVPLGDSGPSASPGGRGETLFRSLATRGNDDVLPREHRPGDDMRRIHWRATARFGELMVRREEQTWHSSVTILLDDRKRAHRGVGSASTFEWAVSAVASIAAYYLTHGWRVTVLTTTGHLLVRSWDDELDGVVVGLAQVRLIDEGMSPDLAARLHESSAVVSVLGHLTYDGVPSLGRPSTGFAGCLLLAPGPTDYLTSHGWRTATWTPAMPIDAAWSRIAPMPSNVTR